MTMKELETKLASLEDQATKLAQQSSDAAKALRANRKQIEATTHELYKLYQAERAAVAASTKK